MKNITRTFICPGLGSETFLNMCLAKLKSLRVLYLNSSYFKMLPYSIGNLKQLRVLDLAYNERIKKLPNSICKLNSLQFLDIGGCSELVETPKDMKYMISLRFLRLTTKQKSLSGTGIECLKSLRTLRLVDCENLEYLFAGMECPPTLQTLVIFNCPSLKSLPCGLKCLASLKTLWIHSCEELDLGIKCKNEDDHQDVVSFLSLQKLMIARLPKLINLPSWLLQGSLNSLETILIEYCENLTELPESLFSITTLTDLCIGSCPSLMTLPRALEHLTSLKKLRIMHCESLNLPMEEENDEDQPSGLKLKKLAIVGLPKLTALPRWLLQGSILSLETIWIVDCPRLKTLPAVIQSLTSLNSLYIVDCPQLIDRCEIGAGEDFHKIAHVQKTIIIDSDQVDSQEDPSFVETASAADLIQRSGDNFLSSKEAKKIVDSDAKGGPIAYADLIQFAGSTSNDQLLCFSLFCQSAIKATFIEAAIRKCGGNEEKGCLLYTAYGSTGQWSQFDKIFGQEDAQEPNPEGRVPLGESNCLTDFTDSHLFFGCQLAVLTAFLGPDQVATHALLASDPEVAPWVVNYQRSEEDLIEQTKTIKEPEYKALWTDFSSATSDYFVTTPWEMLKYKIYTDF
ncbi:hypothetical protein ACFE04_014291 [Oxalis oulophora]